MRWPFSLSVTLFPSLVIRGGNALTLGPKVIVVGVATLVLGAGTGIATAAMMTSSSPVDSAGVIHGCWTNRAINGGHVFALQDAGTNCRTAGCMSRSSLC